MASLRAMTAGDLTRFENCNMDPLTETYQLGFYLEYLAKWPHLCHVMVGRKGDIEGYILGKTESSPHYNQPTVTPYSPHTNKNPHYLPWHAHITALTIAPHARRQGHARRLTQVLEAAGNESEAWFVDLYVRTDNQVAIGLYGGMGWIFHDQLFGSWCLNDVSSASESYFPAHLERKHKDKVETNKIQSYTIYRKVTKYYTDGTDAYDMRKPLKRDVDRLHVREKGRPLLLSLTSFGDLALCQRGHMIEVLKCCTGSGYLMNGALSESASRPKDQE